MPPYSSLIDGSLRLVSSTNPVKHGNGSLLVQNGAEFFGQDNQYLKSSNPSADLYVQSAKDLRCESVGSRWDTANTYNVNASSSLNLVSVQQAKLESTSGDCRIKASSSIYEEGQHRFGNYSSSIQDTAYGNVIFTATTGNFQATCNSNATILSNTGDSKLYATSGKADVKGLTSNLQATGGDVSVQASADVNLSGVNVSQTATTKATLSAPEVDINCATIVKVEAPNVEIGKTSDVVTISQAGKQTNVEGNLTIAGNFTVNGTTTTVDTQNVLVKDNLMVLNSASEIGKDAGLIFHRNNADSTSFYWDESAGEFVFGLTESLHTDSVVVNKDYSDVRCKNINVTESITMPGFSKSDILLKDNDSNVYSFIPGLTKTFGSVDIQIEGSSGGSMLNYKLVKSKATGSPVRFGIHVPSDTDEELELVWADNEAPKVHHKVVKTAGSGSDIAYTVRFLAVSS